MYFLPQQREHIRTVVTYSEKSPTLSDYWGHSMRSRQARSAPPGADQPRGLRRWWLDLHLPDLHGDQVLSELKAEPATAAIPVVVLSADASQGVIRRLLADGALAYLTKPIELAELGELLDTFAATHAKDQQAQPVTGTVPA